MLSGVAQSAYKMCGDAPLLTNFIEMEDHFTKIQIILSTMTSISASLCTASTCACQYNTWYCYCRWPGTRMPINTINNTEQQRVLMQVQGHAYYNATTGISNKLYALIEIHFQVSRCSTFQFAVTCTKNSYNLYKCV